MDSTNEESLFYFESDHLALRGNKDYSALLRTLVVLEAQKKELAKDIDKLNLKRNKYLEDPEMFLKIISTDGDLDLPSSITIAEIPEINFKKYNASIPKLPAEDSSMSESNDVKVRGRAFDQTKPETFNQLWTCEEQRRLEELLIEYPPEPVEMRRFAKIAEALGNRTTHQVASRVQKYFKKLYLAGMPIPGRLPKSRRVLVSKSNRWSKNMFRQSTFFPAHDVPVVMPDDDAFPLDGISDTTENARAPKIKQEGPIEIKMESDSIKSKIIHILETVKTEKNDDGPRYHHVGYKCDTCGQEPIYGTRWHCKSCDQINSCIDFCSDCLVGQLFSSDCHPLHHEIVALYEGPSDLVFDGDSFDYDYDSDIDSNSEYMQ